MGVRVGSCGAQVTAWLNQPPAEPIKAITDPGEQGIPCRVRCDNSTGSSVYVVTVDEVVSDGKWLMSAFMDQRPVLHRYWGLGGCGPA